MADTVTPTYTADNAYEQRAKQYRSQVGDNPEAIRQAVAQEMTQSNQQLNEAIGGQKGALDAMNQMAAYDQQLAGQVRAGNVQAQQFQQSAQQQAAALGKTDATSAAATIAQGPAQLDLSKFTYTPQEGTFLSPFVASQLVSGQQQAAQGQFDISAQQRGSLERAIGTEAESIAAIAQAQIAREEAERERQRQQALDQYNSDVSYAQVYGGTVVNPLTGKEEVYKSETERTREELAVKQEMEKKAQESAARSVQDSLRGKTGKTGMNLIDEVISGSKPLKDILRENAGQLSQDELYELVRVNTQAFGQLLESDQELRAMGLDPNSLDQLGIPRAGAAINNEQQEIAAYAQMVTKGETNLDNVPQAIRGKVAAFMTQQPAQKPEMTESAKKSAGLAKRLLESDTGGITGNVRFALSGKSRQAEGVLKQLLAELQLEESKRMKGQGTMTDSERDLLANSIAAFNLDKNGRSRLNDKDFKAEISRLYAGLTGQEYSAEQQQQGSTAAGGLLGAFAGSAASVGQPAQSAQVDQFASQRSMLQPGEVLVRDPNTGEVGAVQEAEAANYERI